jgi:hypothetical protein
MAQHGGRVTADAIEAIEQPHFDARGRLCAERRPD